MTKETRANLLFLVIFLAISLPGGVILFKKKLDPAVPPMYLPETTRRSLPYIAPADAPDLERYVPDELAKWVRGLARERGYDGVLRRGGMPVISGQRRWQVVGIQPVDKGERVDLLLWDVEPADSSLEVSADANEGRVEGRQVVAIPEAIRKELIYGGYPKPPKEVTWVSVSFDKGLERKAGTVMRIRQKSSVGGTEDSVTLFTN